MIENERTPRTHARRAAPYERHEGAEKAIFHLTGVRPDALLSHPKAELRFHDIALFGSPVGRRREWIDLLQSRYGDRFHHLGGVAEPGCPPLPIADYAQALRQTRICINTQTYPFRKQCKGKVGGEALGCGTLLLEEDKQRDAQHPG